MPVDDKSGQTSANWGLETGFEEVGSIAAFKRHNTSSKRTSARSNFWSARHSDKVQSI
jgi:hypothetical protein